MRSPRRDAPAPMTAGHRLSGEGIYPKVHGNTTKSTQLFTRSSCPICIISVRIHHRAGALRRAIRTQAPRSVAFDWEVADGIDDMGGFCRRHEQAPGGARCPRRTRSRRPCALSRARCSGATPIPRSGIGLPRAGAPRYAAERTGLSAVMASPAGCRMTRRVWHRRSAA